MRVLKWERERCLFEINVSDFENDSLTFVYELMPESTDKKAGGDFEAGMKALDYKVIDQSKEFIKIKSPSSPEHIGFMYVKDDYNNVATLISRFTLNNNKQQTTNNKHNVIN